MCDATWSEGSPTVEANLLVNTLISCCGFARVEGDVEVLLIEIRVVSLDSSVSHTD